MGFSSFGSKPAPPIRLLYSLVLKSLMRMMTGFGWKAAAMRERPRESRSTKYSVRST
ncbi:hypothetical protein D3C77_310160 [compost metagenome]